MRNKLLTSQKAARPFFRYTGLLLLVLNIFVFAHSYAAEPDDTEVVAFFKRVEETFKGKNIARVAEYLHKDFSYIMTYCTESNFSFLESDLPKYRANVGSFFKSKPEIREYSITVDDIQRYGADIMVVARIKSVVQLSGIINSCDASSNYLLRSINGKLFIMDVRGDATCSNSHAE